MRSALALLPFLFILLSPAGARAADASAGGQLVQSYGCAGCHGAGLTGGSGPKLVGIEHRRSAAQIANALANPKAPMPKFPLTEAQVGQVVAYLSSLDGGSTGAAPVATLDPAKPTGDATLTLRFPGTPPKTVTAVPEMQMGGSTMNDAAVKLAPTADPHVWKGKLSFSMGGPYTIDVRYDGKHLKVPVNVGGGGSM